MPFLLSIGQAVVLNLNYSLCYLFCFVFFCAFILFRVCVCVLAKHYKTIPVWINYYTHTKRHRDGDRERELAHTPTQRLVNHLARKKRRRRAIETKFLQKFQRRNSKNRTINTHTHQPTRLCYTRIVCGSRMCVLARLCTVQWNVWKRSMNASHKCRRIAIQLASERRETEEDRACSLLHTRVCVYTMIVFSMIDVTHFKHITTHIRVLANIPCLSLCFRHTHAEMSSYLLIYFFRLPIVFSFSFPSFKCDANIFFLTIFYIRIFLYRHLP